MNGLFALFVVLQAVDFATTAVVFALGGTEQNPLIQFFMGLGPYRGLALAKLAALAIGTGCFLAKKYKALRLANIAFTGIALWNAGVIALLIR